MDRVILLKNKQSVPLFFSHLVRKILLKMCAKQVVKLSEESARAIAFIALIDVGKYVITLTYVAATRNYHKALFAQTSNILAGTGTNK